MNTKNLKIALLVGLGVHVTASDSFADKNYIGACVYVAKDNYQCCYSSPPVAPQNGGNGYFCNDDPMSLASPFSSLPSNCCEVAQNQPCPSLSVF